MNVMRRFSGLVALLLVCGVAQVRESVSGGGSFEAVHLAKKRVKLFAGCGSAGGGGA